MTAGTPKRMAPEAIRARVITHVAVHDDIYTPSSLARVFNPSIRSDISRAAQWFRTIGWVEHGDPRPLSTDLASAGKVPHLKTTPQFWEMFHGIVHDLDLPEVDNFLYTQALTNRRMMELLDEKTIERDSHEAGFLGRTALLGQRHDLASLHGWFSGSHGWSSLVTIQALTT